jgi:hypothetical protein
MPDNKPGDDGLGLRGTALRKAADLGVDETNFVKEALKWQYNWIGLAGAAAFAIVSGSGLPLLLAAGLEMIYVSVVPQSSRFRRLVRSWQYAEEKRKHELNLRAMFLELTPEMKSRYEHVLGICGEIRANYSKLSSTSQMFVGQMEERLQGLLYGYVRLLHAAHQQGQYLKECDAASIQRDLAQLQKSLDKEVPKVQEINRKRIEILNKRLEKFQKIRENSQVVQAQCSATEDVLELICDQSMTMRDPQEINDRLDSLVQDVEQTESTVREMEALFDMATPESSGILQQLPSSEPQATPRPRLRN